MGEEKGLSSNLLVPLFPKLLVIHCFQTALLSLC